MANASKAATFSIERDGQEYDVHISREAISQAIGQDSPSDEAMASWLQEHLADLSDAAYRKLDNTGSTAASIELTADDWAGRRPT